MGVPLTSEVEGYIPLEDMIQSVIAPLQADYHQNFGGAMGWQFLFDQDGSWANGIGSAFGYLYVFHQGSFNNGQLWYDVFTGVNWQEDLPIRPLGMSASPSAVRWKGGITVCHQGSNNNGQLWYTFAKDGIISGADTPVPGLALSGSPSAVVYNGLLYVFHQGANNNGQLWYTVFDGTHWSVDTPIGPLAMSGSPAAVLWA